MMGPLSIGKGRVRENRTLEMGVPPLMTCSFPTSSPMSAFVKPQFNPNNRAVRAIPWDWTLHTHGSSGAEAFGDTDAVNLTSARAVPSRFIVDPENWTTS